MNQKIKLPAKSPVSVTKTPARSPAKVSSATKAKEPVKAPAKATRTVRVAVKKSPVIKQNVAAKVSKATPGTTLAKIKSAPAKLAVKAAPKLPANKIAVIEKKKKQKVVRDSFKMPESDYAYFVILKKRCIKVGASAKKSELLRAALKCLSNLSDAALKKIIAELEPFKAGKSIKPTKL